MGLFDFLKAKKQEEIKKETSRFDNLDVWIKNKKEIIQNKENEFAKNTNARVLILIEELENCLEILEKIDLKNKRAEEKIKLIVLDNLSKYIFNLKRLIGNLRNITDSSYENLINRINSFFISFEQKSLLNFEKATFLIGKELENVKKSISGFFRNFNKNIEENRSFFESLKSINFISRKLKEIQEIDNLKNDAVKNEKNNIETIKTFENEKNKIESKIHKIKKSEEYHREIKKKQELEEKKQNIEKEILDLRNMIDFRHLGNIFHSDSKKMSRISEYKNNFSEEFKKDNGERILMLLKETEMNTEKISEKISRIVQESQEKESETTNLNFDSGILSELNALEKKIKNIIDKIQELKEENLKENRKNLRFEENKNEIIKEIKNELVKMNIEVV